MTLKCNICGKDARVDWIGDPDEWGWEDDNEGVICNGCDKLQECCTCNKTDRNVT